MSGPEAYKAAGYSAEGHSLDTMSSRLMKKVDIQARIVELRANIAERVTEKTAITMAKVVEELAKIGFANMADYMRVGAGGDPILDFSKITRDQAAALCEVTVEDFTDGRGDDKRDVRRVKFKLADKRAALVDIGRHLGGFIERRDVKIRMSEMTDEQLRDFLTELGTDGAGPTAPGPSSGTDSTRH